MAEKPTYLLIDSQVLPDVFLKVVRAKEMLARGKVKSAAMAARGPVGYPAVPFISIKTV